MEVLKVVAEGLTTSFRYPHFMQQIHPTYEMPPPATIYGHICSALGEWFDPAGVRFAYHFTFDGQVKDIEHIIVLSPGTSYLPGSKTPKVLEGNVTPFERHVLFRPRLTLYVNRPDWEPAFRSPRYAVALGRSQDLFTYTSIEVVEVVQSPQACFEHTLLPYGMALQVQAGVTVLMPRYLNPQRRPTFERYVVLHQPVTLPGSEGYQFGEAEPAAYWVDPTAPACQGAPRGLAWLSFIGE